MLIGIISALVNIVGMMLLFYYWRNKSERVQGAREVAWTFIFISFYGWSNAYGIEFGSVYFCVTTAISAWILTGINRQSKPPSNAKLAYENQTIGYKKIAHGIGTFFVAGPLCMLSSCLITIILFRYLPMERANALVAAAFTFPIVWALISYWTCAKEKLLIPFISVLGSGVVISLFLFI